MDQVPWLRSGVGATPADGGCIMQVIDWLDRAGWSDDPKCVHPVLRVLAIRANDSADNNERQNLLALAPRLMGTNTGDEVLTVRLAIFCARHVLDIYERAHPGDDRPRRAIEAAERWADCPCGQHANAATAAYAGSAVYNAVATAAYAAGSAVYNAAAADYAAYAAYAAATAIGAAAAYAANNAAYAANAAINAANAAINAGGGAVYDLLIGCLDEYDRLTGRTTVEDRIDWSPVCEVMGS